MGHPTMQENDTAKLTPTIFREAEYIFALEKNTFVYETISNNVVCLCQHGICG